MNANIDASRIEELFLDAIEQPTNLRATYVDRACAGDHSLRSEVLKLLQGHEWADEVLPSDAALDGEAGANTIDDEQRRLTLEIGRRFAERIGRYRVIRLLGAGGMGMVFLAEQEKPKRLVALKVVRPGVATSKMIRRFEMESQVLGRLQHPGIAQIYEADTADTGEGPQPYFVMEYVRGMPLLEYAERRGYRTQERLELLTRICAAVQHAHRRGVIHRDLKPTNILVTDDGQPKILDFGVARTTDLDIQTTSLCTDVGQLVGTVPYMSPEQTLGDPEELDTRSDVYALGVIGYELLAGRPPYDLTRKMIHEAVEVIRETTPTPLSAVNRVFRGDLETIFGKALAKEPSRRYQSVSDLADDIGHYLHDEPIEARPPSASYQLRKFARRHRVSVTAGIAVAVALMLGTTVSSIGFVQASHEREQAVSDRDAAREARVQAQSDRDRALAAEREAHRQAYVANLYAADAGLRFHEISEAGRRLEDCRPDLRGWEWWHLKSQLDNSVMQLEGHEQRAFSVAISPDGKRFIAASWDHTIRMWDAAQGDLVATFRGHEAEVMSIAFAPDGRRIVSGSSNSVIRVWDAASGENLLTLRGHTGGWITSVQYSPDGSRIVSAGNDFKIRLWDAGSGEQLFEIENAMPVRPVLFSLDGARLLSASLDGTIKSWDATDGRPLETIVSDFGAGSFFSMVPSPDGSQFYTGTTDKTIRIWDATTGELLGTMDGYDSLFPVLALNADGSRLAASGKGVIQIWDTESRELLDTLVGHESWISSLAISPDGRTILSSAEDGTVRTWSLMPTDWPSMEVRHGARVNSVAISPDGTHIASAGCDKTIRIWNADTGGPVRTLEGLDRNVNSLAYSPDGARLASVDGAERIRIWDPTTGVQIDAIEIDEGHLHHVAFSPDGSRLAAGGSDIRIWDTATGKIAHELDPAGAWVAHLSFSPDGTRLVSLSGEEEPAPYRIDIEVWDAASGRPVTSWQAMGEWGPVVFSADGTKVFGGDEKYLCAWDAATGEKLMEMPGIEYYSPHLAVFPDGRRIVSGQITVRLWDPETGEPLLSLRGHDVPITALAVSASGRRIVSGDMNGGVRIWDTPKDYEPGPALQAFE